MNLDDGMGYGDPQERKRAPWWLWAAGGVIVLLLVVAVTSGGTEPAPPAPVSTPTVTQTHDDHDQAGAPADAWVTAVEFLAGWGSTDPDTRADKLGRTALPGLADGLALTSPDNIVTAAVTGLEVAAATPYSVEFTVHLDGHGPVWLLVTNGHDDRDWLVAQIENR